MLKQHYFTAKNDCFKILKQSFLLISQMVLMLKWTNSFCNSPMFVVVALLPICWSPVAEIRSMFLKDYDIKNFFVKFWLKQGVLFVISFFFTALMHMSPRIPNVRAFLQLIFSGAFSLKEVVARSSRLAKSSFLYGACRKNNL